MGDLSLFGDASLSDAQFRILTAVQVWNATHPVDRPTNTHLAFMCGWLHNGKPSGTKAKRVLRGLEVAGRLDRGTSSGEGQGRITILAAGSPRPAPAVEGGSAEAVDIDLPPIVARPPQTAKATRDEVARQFEIILNRVARRGIKTQPAELEEVASEIDALFGFDPRESCGPNQNPSVVKFRYVRYLSLLDAVANGYFVSAIMENLRPVRPDSGPFRRRSMLDDLAGPQQKVVTWRSHRLAVDKGSGMRSYRRVIPCNLKHYRGPRFIFEPTLVGQGAGSEASE